MKPWQVTRLVWNTSPFFFTNRNLPFDPTGLTVLEAGGYNSLLGKAYTEIAAASISMHKSQGVGGLPRRGARKEYFKPLKGQPMTSSLFEGVDTSWSRLANSESIAAEIGQIISKFNPADPAASVPELLNLRKAMSGIQDVSWIAEKKADLDKIVAACLGLHVEASTATETFTPGQTAAIKVEAINRSHVPVTLQEYDFPTLASQIKSMPHFYRTNSLRRICHAEFPMMHRIRSRTGFVNRVRLAPSLSTIKSLLVYPRIPLLFRSR